MGLGKALAKRSLKKWDKKTSGQKTREHRRYELKKDKKAIKKKAKQNVFPDRLLGKGKT